MSNSQVEACLLINRRIEQRQEHSISHTEITERRVIQETGSDMQHYKGGLPGEMPTSVGNYHPHSNGHQVGVGVSGSGHSPHSSLLSLHSDETSVGGGRQNKHQGLPGIPSHSQQVTTSKVIHEVTHQHQHVGSDTQSIDYVAMPLGIYQHSGAAHQCSQYIDYNTIEHPPQMSMYGGQPEPQYHLHSHYPEYEHYPYSGTAPTAYMGYPGLGDRPSTPQSPSEHSGPPSPHAVGDPCATDYLPSCYDDLADQYRVTPSPGMQPAVDRGGYPPDDQGIVYGYVPPSMYSLNGRVPVVDGALYEDDDLQKHMSNMSISVHGHNMGTLGSRSRGGHSITSGGGGVGDEEQQGMRWRDPNLTEVIGFLNNPNNVIKANAAAYLQHLCYMDDPNKQKTRALGGIPPLVKLLMNESPDVYRNACGALRNLSYGRQNDENKRAIKNAGGIPALISLLSKTQEAEVKELITGVIWNMSSCEDLKRAIIDDAVNVIVINIIIPHSGWNPNCPGETCWSTVFRNASGVLRNVSSAGEYARKKLRDCEGLVDSLLYVVKSAIDKANIGNKIVENCVCVLRNLSYRCQEVEDPNYDKNPLPTQSRISENAASSKGENLGCFGASKKKKDGSGGQGSSGLGGNDQKVNLSGSGGSSGQPEGLRREIGKGTELLWQPEVVQSYLALLQSCSNPETLEAAAGALQNLSACYWQPSIEIRAAVRKEKGLPILVELLRMEVDRVVCAVATALRNLAIDQRNKELIGKYAMRDLVQKLPSGNVQHDQGTSDDTIAAVLATLNEVIKKNAEFSRSLLESGGVERLMNITRQRQKYTPRVLKFAGQVLFTMWQHPELRDVYKKHGWKELDFITKSVVAACKTGGPNSPNNANNTLNRPMASQGGTRYEDRTIKRGNPPTSSSNNTNTNAGVVDSVPVNMYQRNEDIPLADMSYPESALHVGGAGPTGGPPVAGGVRIYPPGPNPQQPTNNIEPLYAQVDLEKKRNRHSNVDPNVNSWSEPTASSVLAASISHLNDKRSGVQSDVCNNSWV